MRWITIPSVLLSSLLILGCSRPLKVETVKVETRRLEVSFSERAETILRKDFPIHLPSSGRVSRITLEPGDPVRRGETLVTFDTLPLRTQVQAQQARTQAEELQLSALVDDSVEVQEARAALAHLNAIKAELVQMQSLKAAAVTELKNAKKESHRVHSLVAGGALPRHRIEDADLALDRAQANLAAQHSQQLALNARLKEAEVNTKAWTARIERRKRQADIQAKNVSVAQSLETSDAHQLKTSTITSPIDGVVLSREVRGPQDLPAGSLLLKLGRLADLEAICEVLSQDALLLKRGTPVSLDPGSGGKPLHGEVRLKEPLGFTKRSPLGVEQQRVRVRISLLDPPDDLGTGYELWARFIVNQKTAPSLPMSSFVHDQDGYYVWAVKRGRLSRIPVDVGIRSEAEWEVKGLKLESNDTIVVNPNEQLIDGQQVQSLLQALP